MQLLYSIVGSLLGQQLEQALWDNPLATILAVCLALLLGLCLKLVGVRLKGQWSGQGQAPSPTKDSSIIIKNGGISVRYKETGKSRDIIIDRDDED